MERYMKMPLLFLLLALPHVCADDCPSLPNKNLSCCNDYNRTLTCVWNSTYVSDHAYNLCTIHAEMKGRWMQFDSSCNLKPVDVSRPTMKKCSMIFKKKDETFGRKYVLNITLTCDPVKHILNFPYKPASYIKLNPPPRPDINFTNVSWNPQVSKYKQIKLYISQLQWKQADQLWSDPSVQTKSKTCDWNCVTELDPDLLIQDERYEARIRVQTDESWAHSSWSDWSPTASWVSPTGRTKPTSTPTPSQPDALGGVLGLVGLTVFVLSLAVILVKTDKTTWIYIVKRIRGPPLPNPEKSFLQKGNFQTWLSPHFNNESFPSLWKPIEIVSVEVTSTVDGITPSGPEAALLEKMKSESSYDSTNSGFSNPSYSQLSPPPPPVSSLTAGNLKLCGADAPCGPAGSQSVGKNAEQERGEVRGKEVEIHQLLSEGSNISEPVMVISDYERVEKPHVERFRLQSLDSGVCSGEDVSQESLEADSINMTDGHDEGPEGEEQREGRYGKDIFQKLFGGSGGIFGTGSIQVCSDYERVQTLQADCPELMSLDSGISSGGEEQVSQEESLGDIDKSTESMCLLSPPPCSALPCSLPSFTPLPLNFSGPGLSPALLREQITPMSINRSVEPSGDGYMPVRQEHS